MLRYLIPALVPALAAMVLSACGDNNDRTSNRSDSTQQKTSNEALEKKRTEHQDARLNAGDQSESESDRRITQLIRQALVADSDLSLMAKNATIITNDGVVTLRGSVDSTVERLSIEYKAKEVSGVKRVNNTIEVNP